LGNIGQSNTRGERVLSRWQFWITTGIAILVAVVAGYTMTLVGQNRAAQMQLAQRAQFIQQSIQLETLYRDMVKAIADLSVRNQDRALSDLLASQGIMVNATPPTAGATAAPAPGRGDRP
jgi:hypothetical protein